MKAEMIDLKDAHALKVTSIEASAAIEKQEAVNKVWPLTQFFSVSFRKQVKPGFTNYQPKKLLKPTATRSEFSKKEKWKKWKKS